LNSFIPEAASIAIIGGADGPTTIYFSGPLNLQGVLSAETVFFLILYLIFYLVIIIVGFYFIIKLAVKNGILQACEKIDEQNANR